MQDAVADSLAPAVTHSHTTIPWTQTVSLSGIFSMITLTCVVSLNALDISSEPRLDQVTEILSIS